MVEFVELNKNSFEEYIKKEAAIIDFYTSWCPPCRVLEEELKKVKREIPIGRLNCDTNIEIARKFEIKFVPTMVLLVEGRELCRVIGVEMKRINMIFDAYQLLIKDGEVRSFAVRLSEFANKHNLMVNVAALNAALYYKGERCPCRIDVKKCPCDDAIEHIRSTGKCYCGLFLLKEVPSAGHS